MAAATKTCPRCAATVDVGERRCPSCGYDASSGSPSPMPSPARPPGAPASTGWVVSAPPSRPPQELSDYDPLRFLLSCIAAAILAYAGWHLYNIRSVGSLSGDGTIFEVFFQGVAFIAWGLAVLSIAVGLRTR